METPSQQHDRILLVEDEAIVALSEKRMIEKHGFEVTVAHSGEEALEMTRGESTFDLILMDIDLGSGIDGTETAEQMLQEQSLPIVFLTSHAEKEYVDRVERITSYGYVLKDSGEFVLIQSIKMALKLFWAHQETGQKEERLSYIVDEAPVGIFESSSSGVFRHVNAELAHILGFEFPEEALSYYTDIRNQLYVSPERREELFQLIEEYGIVRDFRFEAFRVTGEKAYAKLDAQRIAVGSSGETIISGFVVDETVRRKAEAEREQSRRQYRSVVDLAQEIIVRYDLQGKWTFVNDAACRFFQQSRAELLGQHFMDYVHPVDQEKTQKAQESMNARGERVDGLVNRQWTPEGWHFVEWNSSPLIDEQGDLVGHQAIGRDVTEEMNLRDKREHERHKWQELFEQATVGIFLADRQHRIVESNPAAAQMLGYSREELRGMSASELMHPDDFNAFSPETNLHTVLEQGGPTQTERRFQTKNRGYMVALVSMKRFDHLDEEISHVLMFHDITDRKAYEQAVEVYEGRLETTMRIGNLAWWTMDVQSGEVTFNEHKAHMLGYSSESFETYRDFTDLLHPDDYEAAMQAMRDHLSGRAEQYRVDYRIRTSEGAYRWFHDIGGVTNWDHQGKPLEVTGVVIDITEQKQVEDELHRQRAFLQRLLDTIPDVIGVTDLEGHFTYHSTFPPEIGYGAEALLGRHVLEFVHPEDYESVESTLTEFIWNQDEGPSIEYRFLCADGHYVWMETKGTKLKDEQGHTEGLLFSTRNVTHRKETEDRLREREEQYRLLAENASDVVTALDGEWNPQYVSPSISKLLGYSPEELMDMGCLALVHPEDCPRLEEKIQERIDARAPEGTSEFRVYTKSGETKWAEAKARYLYDGSGNLAHIILNERDVTERKRLEDELREQEQKYRLLAENALDIVYSRNIETEQFTYISPSVERVLGYTQEEVYSLRVKDLLTSESYALNRQTVEETIHKKQETNETEAPSLELGMIHKNGSIVPIETRASLVRDEHGQIVAVSGVARDITARKRKEKQLEEMCSRLQKVIDNAPFLITEIDPEGHYILASEATCKSLGLSKEALIGKHFRDVLPQDIVETFQERIHHVYSRGEELTVDDRLNLDGEERVFRTVLCPIYQDDNTVRSVLGIGHDVSEQVRAFEHKDFLLRELNHRVKNNLRMVSSLVELKDSALGDAVDLSDIRHQVQAIEKVHASLQESDQITHIRLRRYVEDILSTVFRSFTSQAVAIENHIPDISIRTKAALPIGLIVNETATNAIKHGFTGDEEARFSVTMEEDPERENYVLTISNTGVPLPEDVDIENPQTLGLQLIQALVSQLQGTLEVQRTPNPVFTIRVSRNQT